MENQLGQYFTTNVLLQEEVYKLILNNPARILEPSVGRGDLVQYVKSRNSSVIFDIYEIDKTIEFIEGIKDSVIFGDFLTQNMADKRYKTIIGNPPYVKTSKGNLYLDFINKCYKLLDNNGELIFIVPSDFLKLTGASTLIINMLSKGSFTHIFHPNNEKLFIGASIDVIIFRYEVGLFTDRVLYNDNLKYLTNSSGMITFSSDKLTNKIMFKDLFDIYVGMVSGKEDVYKNVIGNLEVLNSIDKIDTYIYLEKFPSGSDEIDNHLLSHKEELINRGIRKFTEKNWFEWGAPRNIATIRKRYNEPCIYISTLSRKDKVAFVGNVRYFGASLLMIIPKVSFNSTSSMSLESIVSYLNSEEFKTNFIFSGRFKLGHRQLANSYI
jgi:adenine-specific DNA-methyltransferase